MSLAQIEVIEHDAANGVSIERETLTDYSQGFNVAFTDESQQRATLYAVDEKAAYRAYGFLRRAVESARGE